jgi:hypothetical protein
MSELRNYKYSGMEETVRTYLVSLFDNNPEMEVKWDTPVTKKSQSIVKDGVEAKPYEIKRTIADCIAYLKREAHKLAGNQTSIAVDDQTVYGWINHYIEEEGGTEVHVVEKNEPEEAKEEPKEEKTVEAKTGESNLKKPKAEKKKTAEEQGLTQLSLFGGL